MAPRVNEGLVAQLMDITRCSKKDAEQALKAKDSNIERAIDYILTGDLERDRQKEKEQPRKSGMFSSLRNTIRSKSPLKNRRPSPSSTTNSSLAEIVNVSEDDEDDPQLRLAMAMSLAQPQSSSSGASRAQSPVPGSADRGPPSINDPHRPYFGPARQNEYREGQWDIVLSNGSAQETGVVGHNGATSSSNTATWTLPPLNFEPEDLNSEASERKRVEGVPTVLDTRSGSGTWGMDAVSTLAGLMTILHQIPRARLAFLLASPREPVAREQLQVGERWWKGGQISSIAPSSAGDGDVTGEAVLLEAAKIMAFLDDTDRSYGRISQYLAAAVQNDLLKVPQRGESKGTDVTAATFLHRWTSILDTIYPKTFLSDPQTNLFQVLVYCPADPSCNVKEHAEYITEIVIGVPRILTDAGTANLIDALEAVFWGGDKPACFKSLSDVLLITLRREDNEDGAGVEILPRCNVARFMWENYEQTEKDIAVRRGLMDSLKQLAKREEVLTWIERGGKKVRAQEVLEATLGYVTSLEGNGVFAEGEESDGEGGSSMDIDSERKLPSIAAELKSSLESLSERLQEFRKSTETLKKRLSQVFDFPPFITRAADTPDAPPTRISTVYLLRGVIVDQHLTFFSRWQHYSNPYKRKLEWYKSDFSTKLDLVGVDEGEVLTIARDRGSEGITTVYVHEDVTEAIEKVLPPEYLREFVQKDNELFEKELNPPVIHITLSNETTTDMDTTQDESTALPVTTPSNTIPVIQSNNPFLRHAQEDVPAETMLINPSTNSMETNPFRQSSDHLRQLHLRSQEKENQDQEMVQ